jgi:glycosyltransferase involved in cell wall biosynthesis
MNTYTPNDLEVFVLTYNRIDYLGESLQSLLNQTASGFDIIVIDNASDDGTDKFMAQFCKKHKNVRYVRNEKNMGSEYSYGLATELATKKLMMCFHDDDLMHPRYLEVALKYFNKFPNLNILSTDCHTPDVMSNDNWEPVKTRAVFCKDYIELASWMYYKGIFAYPAVIYRTESVKNTKFSKKPFGKIDDKPRCVEICKGGAAVVLLDNKFLRYRVHPGQDSSTTLNGPFYDEIINLNAYFYNLMKKSFRNRVLFAVRNIEWFDFCYNWGKDFSISLSDLILRGNEKGAVSPLTLKIFGKHGRRANKLRIFLKRHFPTRYKKITI